jgi:hypothetical protein
MGTRKMLVLLTAVALAGGVAATSVVSAEAARPKKGAVYVGRTSQGFPLRVAINRRSSRRIDFIEDDLRTRCSQLGTARLYAEQFDIRLPRNGHFSLTAFGADLNLDLSFDGLPVDIGGIRHRVFDVTKDQLSGRFVSSRRARGTWRIASAIFDRSTFPAPVQLLDTCDTGVVTWSVRLKRRHRRAAD